MVLIVAIKGLTRIFIMTKEFRHPAKIPTHNAIAIDGNNDNTRVDLAKTTDARPAVAPTDMSIVPDIKHTARPIATIPV